jgi:hypothetical protein
LDEGHTWSSSPQSIAAYRQRKKILRLELKKWFQRIEEMQDPDPNNIDALEISVSSIGR